MKKYILVRREGNKWEIVWRLETREQSIKALRAFRKVDNTCEYRIVKELY